jgi:hypothetical protein
VVRKVGGEIAHHRLGATGTAAGAKVPQLLGDVTFMLAGQTRKHIGQNIEFLERDGIEQLGTCGDTFTLYQLSE